MRKISILLASIFLALLCFTGCPTRAAERANNEHRKKACLVLSALCANGWADIRSQTICFESSTICDYQFN